MKRLILTLALAGTALTGCAQLKEAFNNLQAGAGATSVEAQSPYPKSYELGF